LGRYLIFLCPRCGMPRYCREGQKTAECFYCGFRISIGSGKIRILLRTESPRTAREAVERYKEKIRLHGRRVLNL